MLVAGLPADFPAAICVVVHTAPQSPGVLHEILSRAGTLPAVMASSGQRIRGECIYVAPPDHHLLIEPGVLRLTKGPRENRFRPAVDPLFRSAAQVYGPKAIGVILTGDLDDGTAGLWAIKQLGGTAIVQEPSDAMFPSMPANAMAHVQVDHVVPAGELAELLIRLTAVPAEERAPVPVPDRMNVEIGIANEQNAIDAGLLAYAEPSSYACPECHGVLLEMKEGNRTRFRCHTGHAYSAASLIAAITEGMEHALWTAIRALEEGALLMDRMADHVDREHDGGAAGPLSHQAKVARDRGEAIRKMVAAMQPLTDVPS